MCGVKHARLTPALDVVVAALMWSCAAGAPLPPLQSRGTPDATEHASIEAKVRAAYEREFGLTIDHPAIHYNPKDTDCRGGTGATYLTTTAYLKNGSATTVYSMYFSADGMVTRKSQMPILVRPAGKIRVLAVLVRYPETITGDALSQWTTAQQQINEDHAAFAKRRGYGTPIVVFENTNLVVSFDEIGNPHRPELVRMAAERHGLSPGDYQIVMAIDLNPKEPAGGLSILQERWIYVGNYGSWKSPPNARQWGLVAGTAYQHEMAHHWGWPGSHDWAADCARTEYAPFIAPPVLFGWEDLQGNHVPEILSDAPYGVRR